ncbi:Spy/CpxP family protein refolding chaperone [Cognaticolwellia mytili]|uniref:Spy/CpxP family protein refolding chaperone n=1 Tax=Cognaticolwellia mytili TaxID=1888913 RepID=UPI000A173F36|nr:Spy/CpxP family protein refolding chaperone [Cognaticolwellia mytili]
MRTHKLYSAIKPYLTIGVTVLCLTTFNASANALANNNGKSHTGQHQSRGEQGHLKKQMKKRFKMLANKLELTKIQRQKIRTVFSEMKTDKRERRVSMSGFKEQVDVLAQAREFDEDKFNTLYASFQNKFKALVMDKAKMHHAIMQVLTSEQKAKFSSMGKHRGSLF